MLTSLKAALGKLFGGGAGGGEASTPAVEPIEYNGYRIIPAPYRAQDQFQTAGTIEKDTPEGVKTHAFVRADKYASWDDAVAFTTNKAKQIVDQLGDRMFK